MDHGSLDWSIGQALKEIYRKKNIFLKTQGEGQEGPGPRGGGGYTQYLKIIFCHYFLRKKIKRLYYYVFSTSINEETLFYIILQSSIG